MHNKKPTLPIFERNNVIYLKIENFRLLRKKYGVGESICSDLVFLNLEKSLGNTTFILQLYPNGQYISNGIPSEYITVYVKLISCQNENVQPDGHVIFSINGSSLPNKIVDFKFSKTKVKFILCKLCKLNQAWFDDDFTIVCRINEFTQKIDDKKGSVPQQKQTNIKAIEGAASNLKISTCTSTTTVDLETQALIDNKDKMSATKEKNSDNEMESNEKETGKKKPETKMKILGTTFILLVIGLAYNYLFRHFL